MKDYILTVEHVMRRQHPAPTDMVRIERFTALKASNESEAISNYNRKYGRPVNAGSGSVCEAKAVSARPMTQADFDSRFAAREKNMDLQIFE